MPNRSIDEAPPPNDHFNVAPKNRRPQLELHPDAMIQQRDAKLPVEPAESRTFSIVESVVLIAGFSVAGGFLSRTDADLSRIER